MEQSAGEHILDVTCTEFYAKDNAEQHHTEMFKILNSKTPTVVLRRGQNFYFAVRFSRQVDLQTDLIHIIFNYGPKPLDTQGTRASLYPIQKDKVREDRWDARIVSVHRDTLTYEVYIPPDVPVTLWRLHIMTSSRSNEGKKVYKCPQNIFILFNPWSKDDDVYLEEENLLEEYVLSETGKVYMGTANAITGRRWYYGQFEEIVLPTIVHLLGKSKLKFASRGNVVKLTRAISALINSQFDNGLLIGLWGPDVQDGVHPLSWTGSIPIFEQYHRNHGNPVKYGQCWVFAAACTTICRALGIPSRPVTNYVSAHDTNDSLTLDKYFTRDGEEIIGGPDGECHDSCWKFHVWTDVWMKRRDLPKEYSGWQIIDGTPQELSDDTYQCGPASVEAIRRGEIGYLYDTSFCFASLNADIIHFQEDHDSPWGFSRLRFDNKEVGKKIVTKKIGYNSPNEDSLSDMEDITLTYKNPDGSERERVIMLNAIRQRDLARLHHDIASEGEEDVYFALNEDRTIPFGEPITIVETLENRSDSPRTISCSITCCTEYYTGKLAHDLKKEKRKCVLNPNEKVTFEMTINCEEYLNKIVDHNIVKVYAISNVEETKQSWSSEQNLMLEKLALEVNLQGNPIVGEKVMVHFTFRNPLDVQLTGCTFSVEAYGIHTAKTIHYRDIAPRDAMLLSEVIELSKDGPSTVFATFNSDVLKGVTGSVHFDVKKAE